MLEGDAQGLERVALDYKVSRLARRLLHGAQRSAAQIEQPAPTPQL